MPAGGSSTFLQESTGSFKERPEEKKERMKETPLLKIPHHVAAGVAVLLLLVVLPQWLFVLCLRFLWLFHPKESLPGAAFLPAFPSIALFVDDGKNAGGKIWRSN